MNNRIFDLNPLYCPALSNLGQVYYELKNYEESFNAIYQCMKIDVRFKEAQTIFRELITNSDLKDLSLNYHKLDGEFSESFLKLLRWLKKFKEKIEVEN